MHARQVLGTVGFALAPIRSRRCASIDRACVWLLAVVAAVTVVAAATAQSLHGRPLAEDHQIDHWTSGRGLPHDTVRAVLQARDGYLWVATRSGLGRFDGVKWTVFRPENTPAMTDPDCRSLAQDGRGNLWVGTADGLLCRARDGFTRPALADGLPGKLVRTLCVTSSGTLWIGTDRGLVRLTFSEATAAPVLSPFLEGEDIYALCEDATGTLWAGTSAGLRYWHASTGARFGTDRQPPGKEGRLTTGLFQDSSRRLWVVTAEPDMAYYGSLGYFLNSQWFEVSPGAVWCPGSAPVRSCEAVDGTLWIPGVGDVVRIHPHGGVAVHHLPMEETGGNYVADLLRDAEGGVWAGLTLRGLLRFQPRQVKAWTTNHGLPRPEAWTIRETRDGALWVGTDGGLCRFGEDRAAVWTETQGLSRNMVRALLEDDAGRLWIGTGAGLDCISGGQLIRYRFPGAWYDSKIRALHLGRDGRLWIAAARNLFGVDLRALPGETEPNRAPVDWAAAATPPTGVKFTPAPGDRSAVPAALAAPPLLPLSVTNRPGLTTAPSTNNPPTFEFTRFIGYNTTNGLPTDDLRAVWEDRAGDLWVGTYGGGLCRLRAGRWERFTTTNGLPSDRVWAFCEDRDGRLWIGTDRGLALHQDGQFTAYTRGHGYFADAVHHILEDDLGHVWVAADRGIGRVPRQALLDFAADRAKPVNWVVYDETEGLPSAETNGQKNHPAACKLRDGRVCFPTPKGVVAFDPKRLPDVFLPPPVAIEQVRANGQVVFGDAVDNTSPFPGPPGASSESARAVQRKSGPGLVFAPGAAHVLEIRYTAPTFVAVDQVRFEHRLEGLDRDWITAGARREAAYANLRPGRYRFQVRATNKYGVASTAPASVALEVQASFHQTGWFYALCTVLLSGSALGLYRWRLGYVRRIHRLEQDAALAGERARIAKDLHDGLGANLTQLTLLADLAEGHRTEPQTLARHLRELSRSTRETVSGLKDFLWATHATDETLDGLLARICMHAENFLAPTGVRCRFDLPPGLPAVALSPRARHHLFLVAQEALNNIARHAQAAEVRIRATAEAATFTLTIADNGRGFTPSSPQTSVLNPAPGCHGLLTMRQRIQELGGRIAIRSQPGQGTVVEIALPCIS